jgi:hypothetical protein
MTQKSKGTHSEAKSDRNELKRSEQASCVAPDQRARVFVDRVSLRFVCEHENEVAKGSGNKVSELQARFGQLRLINIGEHLESMPDGIVTKSAVVVAPKQNERYRVHRASASGGAVLTRRSIAFTSGAYARRMPEQC